MTVIVCPLAEVEALACARGPSHILSLLGPTLSPPVCEGTAARRLHLTFNDVTEPGEGLITPSAAHVAELIDFGRDWNGAAPMLIHCWAGISRSTAAAFILTCDRLGPGAERRIAQRLREASPTAMPNRLLIALADDALERGGAMTSAIAEMSPGRAATAGTPFELALD